MILIEKLGLRRGVGIGQGAHKSLGLVFRHQAGAARGAGRTVIGLGLGHGVTAPF